MEPLVEYRTEERVAVITMNRPDKRNALSFDLVSELKRALAEAERDERVRVVVLTGAGTVFSAGADLAALEALQTATPMENARDSGHLAGLFEQIYLHPKPIIARINGHAIAGGCGLAAVCDVSIAIDEAKFGFTEVRIGFVPAIVMVFVLRKLGETAARELMLRGNVISALEAQSAGLITRSVRAGELDGTIEALANELATETSASAVALTKQMLARIPGMGLQEALGYAVQVNAFARGTADCRAGVRAFLDKSAPPWKTEM